MGKFDLQLIKEYVAENIGIFHEKRIKSLDGLKLKNVLKRKNPYLYKAKNLLTSQEIIEGIISAHISSNEETLFGDWLEGLAIFINKQVYGGDKASDPGIDLKFNRDGVTYYVAIKSGPNWSNAGQIKNLKADFARIKKTLGTSGGKVNVAFINGCCYGKDGTPDKVDYQKLCGQSFWELISGDPDLFVNIIEPLGQDALAKNQEFETSYNQMINKFTREFSIDYCNANGIINWEKLVRFNSEQNVVLKKVSKAKKIVAVIQNKTAKEKGGG